MSRWEFMRQLEKLLSDISPNEREEALQYYNDYFNDAGMENEQEVIKALGSPEQVAKIVKDGLGDGGNQGEFTENGFLNSAVRQNELMKKEAASGRDAGAVQEGEAVKEDGSTFGQNTDTFGDGYSQSSDDTRKGYDSFGQSNTGSGEREEGFTGVGDCADSFCVYTWLPGDSGAGMRGSWPYYRSVYGSACNGFWNRACGCDLLYRSGCPCDCRFWHPDSPPL